MFKSSKTTVCLWACFCTCMAAPAVVVVMVFTNVARAEHAVIDLQLLRPDGERLASAIADQEPPPGGVNPRPLATVKAGDPLVLHFILDNVYPHGLLKQAKIRYYIVRTEKIRQKEVPPLTEGVVIQGEMVMDMKPKCRAGARLRARAPERGIYLVRVDTLNTGADHEHFASIDLKVE